MLTPSKVLLVDNEPRNLDVLEAVLTGIGAELIRATSGAEALEKARGESLAAVLLDVVMPEMDGFEAAREFRGIEGHKATPILFITATQYNQEVIKSAYGLGAVDYIIKPVIPEILRSKVESFVRLHKSSLKLRQAQRRTLDILENSPNAIMTAGKSGEIEMANSRASDLFGLPAKVLCGRRIDSLIAQPSASTLARLRGACLEAAQPPGLGAHDMKARHKDGSLVDVEVALAPLTDGAGEAVQIIYTFVDITQRLETEKLLQDQVEKVARVNQKLEMFAYAASHDLKAPLRVIGNSSRWLEEDLGGQLDDNCRESLQLLRSRADRLERLVDDLLIYSRIGRASDAKSSDSVAGDVLLNDIVLLLSPPEGFEIRLDPRLSKLSLYRMPLQHILMNLIANGIKHHDKESGRVEIRVEDTGECYAFAVADDGPGIPGEFHGRVFEMFQSLKPRDQMEGSGMGLAIVQKYIEDLGGGISIESSPGAGTTFLIKLPKNSITSQLKASGPGPAQSRPN